MYLAVGLGNPGIQYKRTFHNCGFDAADRLADLLNIGFNKKICRAAVAEGNIGGEKVLIAKPQTYMNLSGESVRELAAYYKIPLENLIVIYDDYDLPLGSLRIRAKGSAGTHNGMRNIVSELGSTGFARIRIGIKPEEERVPIMDYVLSARGKEAGEKLAPALEGAARAALGFLGGDTVDDICRKFNIDSRRQ